MARKKTTTRTKSKRVNREPGVGPTEMFPTPPPSEDAVTLSVDIGTKTSFRLKVALLHMEASGKRTRKKEFVERALVAALDEFDNEWGA